MNIKTKSGLGWSLHLGRWLGIDVYLHWTFTVMIAGFFVYYYIQSGSLIVAFIGLGMMTAIFGSVVLHEFGHAWMARRFGIPTLDITLYPIGGVARLQRMPREPMQELWIAVAGPAVNLLIAGGLYAVLTMIGMPLAVESIMASPTNLLGILIWYNLALVGFNMIPAFPMDGGRVLRASLAMKMEFSRATQIAGVIGQGVAVVMGMYGLISSQYMLIFIAAFVVMAARQEMQHAIMK